MIAVRQARPEEWPRFKALRLRALASDPSAFGSTVAKEAAFPDATWQERIGRVLVAARGDEWLGMCSVIDQEDSEIVGLWVAPEARGLGAGAALLEAACAAVAARGRDRIHLWSNAANAAALGLYAKCGFAPSGEPFANADGRVFQRLDRALTER